MTDKSRSIVERTRRRWERAKDGEEAFWRHALGQAVVEVLKRGEPVTVPNLIAELSTEIDDGDVTLRVNSRNQAIKILSAFQ